MTIFAIKKDTGETVKIGVAEEMLYLTYDDRHLYQPHPGNPDALDWADTYWRLPYPEDEKLKEKEYNDEPYLDISRINEGLVGITPSCCLRVDFNTVAPFHEHPGAYTIPLKAIPQDIDIQCFHTVDIFPHNRNLCFTRDYPVSPFHLQYLRNHEDEMLLAVRCYLCGKMWAIQFNTVEPYILDHHMKARIFKTCFNYYLQKHEDEIPFYTISRTFKKGKKEVTLMPYQHPVLTDKNFRLRIKTLKGKPKISNKYFPDIDSAIYEWLTL